MRLRLTLSHKALILVSVPLIFELIFVATLVLMLNQVEAELKRENRCRRIIDCHSRLGIEMYSITVRFRSKAKSVEYLQSRKVPELIEEFRSAEIRISDQVNELKELTADNPNQHQTALNIQGCWSRLKKCIDDGLAVLESGNLIAIVAEMHRVRDLITPEVEKIAIQIKALDEEEKAIEQQMPQREADSRRRVQMVLAAGVMLNILLAVMLALNFNRSTTRRLRVLMDNTDRLAKGKALNPRLDGSDEIAHLDAVFSDMANALQVAARKERAIIHNAVDVICSIDEEGTFVAVSPASARVLGYEPEQLCGNNYRNFVFEQDIDMTLNAMAEVRDGKATLPFENRLRKQDGTLVDVMWSVQWSPPEQLYFCVIHDITHRKEIERIKEEFVTMVSHDLRTPLTSVQAALTLLSGGVAGDLSESASEIVTIAEDNVTRLIALINDLLDAEKLQSGKLELQKTNVPLTSLFQRSVHAIEAFAAKKGIKIIIEDSGLNVLGDEDRLIQVMINLISNAVKFSNDGESITVKAEADGEMVLIKVIDQGCGVPQAFMETIFERFQQVRVTDATKKGGSGLGLSICKAIVESHGGKIGVQSQEEKGSTFWFSVPKSAPIHVERLDDRIDAQLTHSS